jgi:hypothetical protein
MMARQSPTFSNFNPTGDKRVAVIKTGVDALIEVVRAETAAGGEQTQRRAREAVTNFEQGAMWAVKALFSDDAVRGDDGGSGTGEPAARVEDEADLPPASA